MGKLRGGFWTSRVHDFEPKAQFRFRVEIDGLTYEDAPGSTVKDNKGDYANDQRTDTPIAWYAKSVDKPGFDISDLVGSDGYWNMADKDKSVRPRLDKILMKKITMTLVDPTYPNVTRKLLRWLRRSGYNDDTVKEALETIGREDWIALHKTIGDVRIFQLSPLMYTGPPTFSDDEEMRVIQEKKVNNLEVWTLHNAYPKSIDFGKLDYSSSDLVEIKIDWVYSNFSCRMIKLPEDTSDIEQAFTYFKDFSLPHRYTKDLSEMTCLEIFKTKKNTGYNPNSTDQENDFKIWKSKQTGRCFEVYTSKGDDAEAARLAAAKAAAELAAREQAAAAAAAAATAEGGENDTTITITVVHPDPTDPSAVQDVDLDDYIVRP